MGFSVYGRIGGQNDNATSNYGRNSYYPTVIASRNYLNVGTSKPRVYAATTNNVAQPHNPKSTTFQKKENKGLKTALLLLGTAVLAYKGAPLIKRCTSKIGSVVNSGMKEYSKHCPNMAQAGKSLAAACKAPINGCKKIGSFVAKPFVAIGKLFAKKP